MDKRQPRVLLVDDDMTHRTMLKVNLQREGFRILEASDGDEVLPVLKKQNVDLILLDMKNRTDGRIDNTVTSDAGRSRDHRCHADGFLVCRECG